MNPPGPPAPTPAPGPARGPNRRQIRGPQSALTDFLASHNISASQIRQDANARRAAALAAQQAAESNNENATEDTSSPSAEPEPLPSRRQNESKASAAKRKKEEEKAIAKIKASKRFKRRKDSRLPDEGTSDDDDVAREIFQEFMAPLPGQMENCAICEKRFTVSAYSRTGPDGGLLCPECTKELDQEEGSAKKKRKTAAGRQRRQLQSNLLDGIYPGAKDLMTLCVETLAKNVDQAEDLGDLPASLVDRLAAILSKRRLMNSSTLNLFLQSNRDTVTVYDGSKLSSDDYIKIFQIVPNVKNIRVRNAIQFKNRVIDHILATPVELEKFSIHGANLIDDERWDKFLAEKGSHLKSLKVYHTDGYFGDEQIESVTKSCPNLQRLKICHNQKVTDKGIAYIANLPSIQYLSLEIYNHTTSPPYVDIINSIGPGLRTLSLATVNRINDTVLEAIHENCQNICKLRITDNDVLTDKAFADLFTNWYNPPLLYVDLHKCRHIDASNPRDNTNGIGLCSLGFEALMAHSGSTLKHLNIHSCRHISGEAFEKVFAPDKVYPELAKMDVSFCRNVTDFVVASIFRTCPNLKTLTVFGNFGVRDVKVPEGRILIGVPNALGMQIEGTEEGNGMVI